MGATRKQTTDYLLIDISNSYTKLAFATRRRLSKPIRIPTAELSAASLRRILATQSARTIFVSSVVPKKNKAIMAAAGSGCVLFLSPKLDLGVGIDYPDPRSIGADRLANAAAVAQLYGAPAIVVDFGTAVTFDVVSAKGDYIGGVIAPGLEVMTKYLYQRTALLPKLTLREPPRAIGKTTRDAMMSVPVISSFAATNVAPTKAELEAMYNKAFREFSAANYDQALKELDAIDARQPDLAESQNLRGVILMRQAQYDQAETALQKALATDPKFWNARFNLAEIPFLRKNWAEARKRFEGLLQGNTAELQGEASQLIQYKILLTYLLEGKENMVDSILAKFELTPDTPAVAYSNAAVAFQHKNEKEAKDLIAAGEKKFSPQLNKLFAESFYEIGWMQKPAGQTRPELEITTAADRAAKAKAIAAEKFEQAEQAFQQRDYTAAKRLIDEADAADPNQPATINLRGEILLAQKDFDGAENAFKQAAKIDPKFREAQYNLAQIPFKKKEYTKARDRFEALFNNTPAPGGDKNQAAQIIKFKIYLTLLLEGKDSRAQKMMEQFQFTGDTPALYYAQAAWEFKHNNTAKANDWIVSAKKIYSPALNMVFADSFYDVGWLQPAQNVAAAPVSPSKEVAKNETTPAIEPSPIPAPALALNKGPKTQEIVPPKTETTTQAPAITLPLAKNEKTPGP